MELDGKAIIFAEAKESRSGREQLHIWTTPTEVHAIAPEAIASWSELVGYAEPEEALEAILEAAVESSEPTSGPSVWMDAYDLLRTRERAREYEAARANEEGKANDPRSPKLRATLAAHKAVHEPIDGGECVMDRCRRVIRERMGLPEPSRKCGAASRNADVAPRLLSRVQQGVERNEDRQKLQTLTAAMSARITPDKEAFLHGLTHNRVNPLEDGSKTRDVYKSDLDSEHHLSLVRKYTVGDRSETHPPVEAEEVGEIILARAGTHPHEGEEEG